MALIVCPYCGTQVSDKAKKCPQCGNNPHKKPRREWGKKDYIILSCIIAAVIAVGVALFFILRPDPYLKKGRDFISKAVVEKIRTILLEEHNTSVGFEQFDISALIGEEWDRETCISKFGIPLDNNSVYSVCAYSFSREPNLNGVYYEDGEPMIPIIELKEPQVFFVVFRHAEPILFLNKEALLDKKSKKICVVKENGESIPIDFCDNIELDYIDATTNVNGSPNPQECAKRMSDYLKEKYGDYEFVCSCNSVDEIKRQHSVTVAEETISETSLGEGATIDGFEYNAQLLDHDGDYSNIRNAPSGTVVEKLYGYRGTNEYYMYLTDNKGEWWRIRDNKVYDKSSEKVRYLEGNQAWIHSSCIKRMDNQVPQKQGTAKRQEIEIQENDDETIYQVVDQDPEFVGGMEALFKYLRNNMIYPQEARDNNISGHVYITFVIEKDGRITNPKVLRDIGGGCGAEAIRLVENMPKWKPGRNNGRVVRVQFNLPVRFSLQ